MHSPLYQCAIMMTMMIASGSRRLNGRYKLHDVGTHAT